MKTTKRLPSWKLAVAKTTATSSRTGGNLTRRGREAILTRASFNAELTKSGVAVRELGLLRGGGRAAASYLWPRLSKGGAARLLRRPMRPPTIKGRARTPTPEPIHTHAGKPLSSADEPAAVFPPAELLDESDDEEPWGASASLVHVIVTPRNIRLTPFITTLSPSMTPLVVFMIFPGTPIVIVMSNSICSLLIPCSPITSR